MSASGAPDPSAPRRPVRGIASIACAIFATLLVVAAALFPSDTLSGQSKQLAVFAVTLLSGVSLVVGTMAGFTALMAREDRQLARAGIVANILAALVLVTRSFWASL